APPPPQDQEEAPPPPEEEEAPAPKKVKKKNSASELMVTNKFVVKEQSKMFSTRKRYELLDGDTGKVIGTAEEKAGWFATILGMAMGKDKTNITIEVRQKPNDALVFSICRRGFFFKKVLLLNNDGGVVGRYKTKLFSLKGGFHVYDQDGKHVIDIKGNWFK